MECNGHVSKKVDADIFNPLTAIRANICDGKFDLLSVLDP